MSNGSTTWNYTYDANGMRTRRSNRSTTYDSMYRMATAIAAVARLSNETVLAASYTFSNDLLTEIETGSATYSFSYGDFAQRSSIKIGSRTLAYCM